MLLGSTHGAAGESPSVVQLGKGEWRNYALPVNIISSLPGDVRLIHVIHSFIHSLTDAVSNSEYRNVSTSVSLDVLNFNLS